jgi:poly(A) polymerase
MIKPSTSISLPAAMTSAPAKAVMAALSNWDKDDPAALFVGGCVRNALTGHVVDDIDIATIWLPQEIIEKLENVGIRAIPTGIEHGTITAVADGMAFEITTLRRDVETDGRRAVVAFTQDWAEDAARRDFTMNTLLADGTGNIFDPTREGLADLKAGRVVFVGNPAQRIAEDYLRILRFFRFHALYGMGMPDSAGLAACSAAADKIVRLSRERITQEMLRILGAPDPASILQTMFDNNVMRDLPDHAYLPSALKRLCLLQYRYRAPDNIARLAVVAGTNPSHISRLEKYFTFSRQQYRILELVSQLAITLAPVTEKRIKTFIYKHGSGITIQAVLIYYAQRNTVPETYFESLLEWQPPSLPVSGDDVTTLGISPGPEVGRLLGALEEWWIEQNFTPSRMECMDKLGALMEVNK